VAEGGLPKSDQSSTTTSLGSFAVVDFPERKPMFYGNENAVSVAEDLGCPRNSGIRNLA